MKIQELNLSPNMRIIRNYLKEGKFIQVVHDHATKDVERIVTDEEGNDMMLVNHSTMKALVRRGVVKQRPAPQRTTLLHLEQWVLAR